MVRRAGQCPARTGAVYGNAAGIRGPPRAAARTALIENPVVDRDGPPGEAARTAF